MSINSVSLQGDREKWHSSGEVRKDRGGHLLGDFVSVSFSRSEKVSTFTLQSSWRILPRTHSYCEMSAHPRGPDD